MKNILSTLLVSVLLLGCSTDDDTMADILPTTIDLNLVGVWRFDYSTISSTYELHHDYVVLTFSKNGKFSRSYHDYFGHEQDNFPDFIGVEETFGDYWIEDNLLMMSYDNGVDGYVYVYNLNDNELSLTTPSSFIAGDVILEPHIYIRWSF